MKQSQEIAKCDSCGTAHVSVFPVAENQEEYSREEAKLPRPNVVGPNGEIRTRIPCKNSVCGKKIGIPLLGKDF